MNVLEIIDESASLASQVDLLFKDQLENWDLAKANYQGLQKVVSKSIPIGNGLEIFVQSNPERLASTSAKVDPKSISERKCFLCYANLPPSQKAIAYGDELLLLVNPFPIFPRHLTIPVREHVPQKIEGRILQMLQLAKELEDYVVFYNGPRCGASAPDHFHFQAGNKDFLPLLADLEKIEKTLVFQNEGCKVWAMNGYLRKALVISGSDVKAIEKIFSKVMLVLQNLEESPEEPMINLLANCESGDYKVFIFPREVHRPWQFFAEGDDKVLFSPGSVDLAGVFILPRIEDFHKMDLETCKDTLQQVTLSDEKWEVLVESLKV
jgi:hypothetical protein